MQSLLTLYQIKSFLDIIVGSFSTFLSYSIYIWLPQDAYFLLFNSTYVFEHSQHPKAPSSGNRTSFEIQFSLSAMRSTSLDTGLLNVLLDLVLPNFNITLYTIPFLSGSVCTTYAIAIDFESVHLLKELCHQL